LGKSNKKKKKKEKSNNHKGGIDCADLLTESSYSLDVWRAFEKQTIGLNTL